MGMLWLRVGFWVGVALLQVFGLQQWADALGASAGSLGIGDSPIPMAMLLMLATSIVGIAKHVKTWQVEKAITDIIPPDPVNGRNYEAEFLHVFMNDLGVSMMVEAAKQGSELLALTKRQQAEGWNVSPPAVIEYIRRYKRRPRLTPAGLADPA